MKSTLLISSALFFACAICVGEVVFSSESEKKAWKEGIQKTIAQSKADANEAAILKLSDYVYKFNNQAKQPELEDLRIESAEALMSIPGHALYYQNKVESMRAEMVANSKKSPDEYQDGEVDESEYSRYSSRALSILKYLPSPETVAVLAHFLDDPDRGARPANDAPGLPVYLHAAQDLYALGIEKPPVGEIMLDVNKQHQVDAWKDWWNEVKSGKRTYRFKGSPIEYGPDGPVTPKEVSRREHDRQPTPARIPVATAEEKKEAPASAPVQPEASPWGKVAAGLAGLLVLAGGWLAFRKRSATKV